MIIVLTRAPGDALAKQLQRSADEEVTYAETGGTRSTILPPGYQHGRTTLRVGVGEGSWQRAQEAIRLWKAHAHAGLTVFPHQAPLEEGSTVLVSRRLGPMVLMAPCRMVYCTREADRYGFGYGTLPGHPVQGEEAFHVLRRSDGAVVAEIVAFSRPGDLSTKIAGPVAHPIQKAATRRYLQGIAAYTGRGELNRSAG